MNQKNYHIAEHLPESLNRDNMRELAETIDAKMAELNQMSELVSIYPRIDELSSNLIDALAIQFHVDYYSMSLPLDARRSLVKNSMRWHLRKGTRAAIDEALHNIYGDVSIAEWFEYGDDPYYFRVDTHGELMPSKEVDNVIKIVNAFKNARSWLRGVIWWPKNLFLMNKSGPLIVKEVPDRISVEKRLYTVFSCGLNGTGEVESEHKIQIIQKRHTDYIYQHGTINGRLMLNQSGDYSIVSRNLGHTITKAWPVFIGSRTNAKSIARLNDASTTYRKKVSYQAEWQDVISHHGNALNSGGVKKREWVSEEKTEYIEKKFARPLYALNQSGKITKEMRDFGHDVTIEEIVFDGGHLNSGIVTEKEKVSEHTVMQTYTTFTASRMNDKSSSVVSNQSASRKSTDSDVVRQVKKYRVFSGALLNGKSMLNCSKPRKQSRVVYVPDWRAVYTRTGAAMLNATKRETRYREIRHVTPGRVEKKFNPTAGALLNSRAAMGYMKLSSS